MARRGVGGGLGGGEVFDAQHGARVLRRVERRFARFRLHSGGGKRIPAGLRQAVVAAVEQGVTRGALERTCGVSWSQVEAWRNRCGLPKRVRPLGRRSVRAFTVVDDSTVAARCAASPLNRELSLRVGPWQVTVRLEDLDPTAGGTCSR